MEFYDVVKKRRTVREFSREPVPEEAVQRARAVVEGLKEFLGVPAGYEIAAVIPFGHPRELVEAGESEDLEARLHIDGWETTVLS